jgi:hypothetical protein
MKLLHISRFVVIAATLVGIALSPVVSSAPARQAGTGSVTARVFICPEGLSQTAVLSSNDPSTSLAKCDPSTGTIIAPRLRATSGGTAQPGALFAEGVYLWAELPLGSYAFSDGGEPTGFVSRLITTGDDMAVTDQEHDTVTISRAVPHIERRFYFFAPPSLPAGAVSLTLYRCQDAEKLSPADCSLLVDPPSDHGSLLPDLWTEPLRGQYADGRSVWHGIPFGIYSIIYSGVLQPGEGAALPELACISTDRCPMVIGPTAPSASLELYIFPIPTEAPDSDGDGFTDLHERAGWTDPNDSSSPGPDRGHSEMDSDTDRLSDQDEIFYRTDPSNADSDEDGVPDGDEIARGMDPVASPVSGNGGSDHNDN